MLTTARPIFQHVPGAFCDPVGLAEQQAAGVVSLIVAHYDAEPPGAPDAALGPVYDAFVAVSGGLLAVARTTPDYRFPVMPAAAVARFDAARDAGCPAHLSLFEVSSDDCARFLETVFFHECLKLHVDGPDSLDLVAVQLDRAGCTAGLLEVNDFSDPAAPRLLLLDAPPSRARLADALDGVRGRVLLYDRAKNRAALPDRSGHAFDLDAAIEQAGRLALARRTARPDVVVDAADVLSTPAEPPGDSETTVEAVIALPIAPRATPPDAHAAGLSALVAELQGRTPAAPLPPSHVALAPPDPPPDTPLSLSAAPDAPTSDLGPPPGTLSADDAFPLPQPLASPSPLTPNPYPPTPAPPAPRHPLQTELDRLRADVYDLVEHAVSPERAAEHEAHVLAEHAIPSPVPADRSADYLRALLTDDPPRSWHFFKRARAKTYEAVAGKLLAFHAANGHADGDAARATLHDVSRLWTRLHK